MAISDEEMIAIIEKVGPSVVNVNTVRLVHDNYMRMWSRSGAWDRASSWTARAAS
jgi:hypothetical protein